MRKTKLKIKFTDLKNSYCILWTDGFHCKQPGNETRKPSRC